MAHHAQKKRQLEAGAHAHPLVGQRADVGKARVDHDHAAAVFAHVDDFLGFRRTHALVIALVEQHDVFRRFGMRRGKHAQNIGDAREDVHIGKHGIGVVVRRSERVHETLRVVLIGGAAVLEHRDARRVGLFDAGGDVGKRLVPRNGGEVALAVVFHRLDDAVFGIGRGGVAQAAHAQMPACERMVLKAHEAPQRAVLRPRSHAALVAASVAYRGDVFHHMVFAPSERFVARDEGAGAADRGRGAYRGAGCEKRTPRKSIIRHKSVPLLRCRLPIMRRLRRCGG